MRSYTQFTWPPSKDSQSQDTRMADLLNARGSQQRPNAPRNLLLSSDSAGINATWDPPQVADGISGWRVYLDTESNLVAEIRDVGTTACRLAITDTNNHNVFVSAVTGTGLESVKTVKVGSANFIGTEDLAPNAPVNATNDATVTSTDAGTDATILVYGPSGPGTNYTKYGNVNQTRPSASILGQPYAMTRFVVRVANPKNPLYGSYLAKATYKECQNDDYEFVGSCKTTAGGGGTSATATAVMGGTSPNEYVASVNVTNGGSGYTSAPTVIINGGGGTGAAGYATLSGDAVSAVIITNSGSGYTGTPTVSFSGGNAGVSGGGQDDGGIGGRIPAVE